MAEHFLSKIRVAPGDFVEADGQPVLERHGELRALLNDRAGPEVAALFGEPLISRGNDQAAPTVSWYTGLAGEARPLSRLSGPERDRAERYLSDHLRPLRALAEDPASAGLALGALSVYGKDDIMVAGDRPVIVNWGLMPGANGANAGARPAHYAATLGRYLPMSGGPGDTDAAPVSPPTGAGMPAAGAAPPPPGRDPSGPIHPPRPEPRRAIPPLAWVPLLVLLVLASLFLAWLLLPGTRLFQADRNAPAITDTARLGAARELNEALRARKLALETALAGAVCRADGQLILPDGRSPEGLLPPKLGEVPERKASAAPDALLPNSPERVLVPDPAAAAGATGETTLLELIEARTVLVLASQGGGGVTTGSGFVIGPGLIMTNQHVVADIGAEGGTILITGKALKAPQQARIVKTMGPLAEAGGDFALLRIDDTGLPAFTVLLPPASLKLTNVVAAGYPGDVLETDISFAALRAGDLGAVPGLTVTDGTINTEQRIGPDTNVLMHSAPLSSGNSGGPLVDMCGRLVGVNAFVRQGRMQNRGFALTTGDMLAFLKGTGAAPTVVSDACAPIVVRPQVAGAAPPETDPSGNE